MVRPLKVCTNVCACVTCIQVATEVVPYGSGVLHVVTGVVHVHVYTCEQLVHVLLETQVTGDCEICTGLTGAKLHVL